MKVEVVQLPRLLETRHLVDRSVVVFDVLRATTSMTAALAAGVEEIRVFGSITEAKDAAGGFAGEKLLCGEVQCLPPSGFDLGNSPGAFCSDHRGRVMFMSTTNGTRAIVAARKEAGPGVDLILRSPSPIVSRVLRLTGLYESLQIEP